MLARGADAAALASDELPAVARAHEAIAVDIAIADRAAVVRAHVVDDDELARHEAGHRDRAGARARRDDVADRDKRQLLDGGAAVVGVVAELGDELCFDGAHARNLRACSDMRAKSAEFLIVAPLRGYARATCRRCSSTSISTAAGRTRRRSPR